MHFAEAARLQAARIPFVVVTVIATRGSTPQDPGASMLVTRDGLHSGTVGGGRVEAAALREALALLADPVDRFRLVDWNLQRDIHMTCGGTMTLFFEKHAGHEGTIVVFGAGHIAQALIPVLLPLDRPIICIDPRADWLARLPSAPNLTRITTSDPAAHVDELPADSSIIIMTQGHSTDLPILRRALAHEAFAFIGVIGSNAKRAVLERDLRESGVDPSALTRFQCPLGLPIGSNHPHEIAISIAADLIARRDPQRTT